MTPPTDANRHLIRREESVLVIIDVQERLVPHIDRDAAVVANIARLARFAPIVELPIVVTEQMKLGPTVAEIGLHLEGVTPITKADFGCFGCEGFAEALSALGRSALILAGIEAHICVAQTALQALEQHTVHVVSDAVGSRTPENRQIALDRMRQAGAVITSTEMVMYELLVRAGTDEFRQALELVKGE
ncbi:MAG: hydrolase [Armatimonadetes bacterium]|nr:hydrolase [Armatimonadota bacterium]